MSENQGYSKTEFYAVLSTECYFRADEVLSIMGELAHTNNHTVIYMGYEFQLKNGRYFVTRKPIRGQK